MLLWSSWFGDLMSGREYRDELNLQVYGEIVATTSEQYTQSPGLSPCREMSEDPVICY